MKYFRLNIFFLLFLIVIINPILSQDTTKSNDKTDTESRQQLFIDKNGDGYNDHAPDHDGDGIPNAIDPDFKKMKKKKAGKEPPFIDLDGDGINDLEHPESSDKGEVGKDPKGKMKEGGLLKNNEGEQKKRKRSGRR